MTLPGHGNAMDAPPYVIGLLALCSGIYSEGLLDRLRAVFARPEAGAVDSESKGKENTNAPANRRSKA